MACRWSERRVLEGRAWRRDAKVPTGGDIGLLDILRTAFELASNGEARRLVAQGAVQIDEKIERDPMRRLRHGTYLVKAGRRRFVQIEIGAVPPGVHAK